jgi:hypothetical protein
MSKNKFLNGQCQHCGGPLRFPAESIGQTTNCPQCSQHTELLLAAPPDEPTVPMKTIAFTVIAVLVLIGGLIAAMIAVKRLQRTAEQRKTAVAPATLPGAPGQAGFQVTAITLEQATNGPAIYAVGSIRNETNRRRLGIKLELELLDAAGNRVGTVTDFHPGLEPRAEWRFKSLVTFPRSASARFVSIKSDS